MKKFFYVKIKAGAGFLVLFFFSCMLSSCTQNVVCSHSNYRIKDSVVYVVDTIYIHHYIDTVIHAAEKQTKTGLRKINLNTSNLGIGPSFGTYYSPFNGFDLVFGFGVQYFFTSIPIGKARQRHPTFHHKIK